MTAINAIDSEPPAAAKGKAPGEPTTHGLELDQLDTAQHMAMKVFVFDRQEEMQYWSNGLK